MDNTDLVPQVSMEVFGLDGEKLGEIDAVEANHFVINKGLIFTEDHYIPFSAINNFESNTVHLNVTRHDALEQDWGQQPVDDNVEPLEVAATGADDTRTADSAREPVDPLRHEEVDVDTNGGVDAIRRDKDIG